MYMQYAKGVPSICMGCHDLLQRSMRFVDVVVVPDGKNDHEIYFKGMSNAPAVN